MDQAVWMHTVDLLAGLAPAIAPALAVGLASGLAAAAALSARTGRAGRAAAPDPDVAALLAEPRELVFREGYLVDHSDGVGFILPDAVPGAKLDRIEAWRRVRGRLERLLPGAAAALDALAGQGRAFRMEGLLGDDRLVAIGVRDGEMLRVTLAAAEARRPAVRVPLATLRAMQHDAQLMLGAVSGSPALSWAVDAECRVVWGNAAYLDMLRRARGPEAGHGFPLPALFPDDTAARSGTWRRSLRIEGREAWFEITATGGSGWAELPEGVAGASAGRGDGRIRFLHAQPIDHTIDAETRLRRFIQSLSGAFAELPDGIAVLDAQDRLVMFNPAFGDITGLSPSWLAARPALSELCVAIEERCGLPLDDLAEAGDGAGADAAAEASPPDRGGAEHALSDGRTVRLAWRRRPDGSLVLQLSDLTLDRVAARRAARLDLRTERLGLFGEAAAARAALAPLDLPRALRTLAEPPRSPGL